MDLIYFIRYRVGISIGIKCFQFPVSLPKSVARAVAPEAGDNKRVMPVTTENKMKGHQREGKGPLDTIKIGMFHYPTASGARPIGPHRVEHGPLTLRIQIICKSFVVACWFFLNYKIIASVASRCSQSPDNLWLMIMEEGNTQENPISEKKTPCTAHGCKPWNVLQCAV